jgi:ABC-type Na+ efflux pump permease subunit
MRLWKSLIVTRKDLSVFKRNRYVLYSLIALPVIMGVILPVTLTVSLNAQMATLPHNVALATANEVANLGTMILMLLAAILPSIIASYSFVGEKIEKSLEPLLATPTTDGELLLGKSLAAFLPCLAVTYFAAAIATPITDYWSYTRLGVLLLPNLNWVLLLFVIAPLACIMSVEANIIVSSRVNDIRAAQQLGSLIVLPIILLVIYASTNAELSIWLAIGVSVALAAADITLFFLSKETFQREEILTKWK